MVFACGYVLCACADDGPEHSSKKYNGVYIDNSLRYGRIYKNPKGETYNYRYMKATITNDSVIPLYLNIAFPKGDSAYTNRHPFNVFLLPENMTPEKQSVDFYREQVMPFLDAGFGIPLTLQKKILPKEACTLTIGFLTKVETGLDPLPIILFSKGRRHHFNSIPDSAIAQTLSANKPSSLFLALDFYRYAGDTVNPYAIIPCGNMWFSSQHPHHQ